MLDKKSAKKRQNEKKHVTQRQIILDKLIAFFATLHALR